MKSPLLIGLTAAVLLTGSALAMLNNACKTNQHSWCVPIPASDTT